MEIFNRIYIYFFFLIYFFLVFFVALIGTFFIAISWLIFYWWTPDVFWRIANAWSGFWHIIHVIIGELIYGINYRYYGELNIPQEKSILLIVNHLAYADYFEILDFCVRHFNIGTLRSAAKEEIKCYGPVGWGMYFTYHVFLQRKWSTDQLSFKENFKGFYRQPDDRGFVLFLHPEGTRFTPKKHQNALQFASERGLKQLQNLLQPRFKGFVACMHPNGGRFMFDYLFDLTLAYEDYDLPTLWNWVTGQYGGKHRRVHIHIRYYKVEDLPKDETELIRFLYKKWEEKDQLLDYFKKNNAFPSPSISTPITWKHIWSSFVNSFIK